MIYHCQVKTISRSSGACAVAKAAYRAGEKLHDEMQDRDFDFTLKEQVLHSEIVLPDGVPRDYANRERLWNSVEQQKTASNARWATEYEIALPNSWTTAEAADRVKEFCQQELVSKGLIADISIHMNKSNTNLHAHVMCPSSACDDQGKFFSTRKTEYANAAKVAFKYEDDPELRIQDKLHEIFQDSHMNYKVESEDGLLNLYVSAQDVNAGRLSDTLAIARELEDGHVQMKVSKIFDRDFPKYDAKHKEETELNRLPRTDADGKIRFEKVRKGEHEYERVSYVKVDVERDEWNERGFVKEIREAWQDYCNMFLEADQQIDARSLRDQGIARVPQVHEGPRARALEAAAPGESNLVARNSSIQNFNVITSAALETAGQLKELFEAAAKEIIKTLTEVRTYVRENHERATERPAARARQQARGAEPDFGDGRHGTDRAQQESGRDLQRAERPDHPAEQLHQGGGDSITRAQAELERAEKLLIRKESDLYERARAALAGAYEQTGITEQRVEPDESTLAAARARAERSERDNNKLESVRPDDREGRGGQERGERNGHGY